MGIAVPGIVGIVLANLFLLLCLCKSKFSFHDLDLLILDLVEDSVVSFGCGDHGVLLVGGQILSGEGDFAEGDAESFVSLGEVLLHINQVDLMLFLGELHLFRDSVDRLGDLGGTEFHLHGVGLILEGLEFAVEFGHLVQTFSFRILGSGQSVFVAGFCLLDKSLSLTVGFVSSTQFGECQVVLGLGVAEVLDTIRLYLLNTGSEKTAGSNHNHQCVNNLFHKKILLSVFIFG